MSVQEDDAAVVRGGLQGPGPDLQPHQSRLVPEDAGVSVTRLDLVATRPSLTWLRPDQDVDESFVSTVTRGQ